MSAIPQETGASPSNATTGGKNDSAKKLFIGGLSWGTTEETLRTHFEDYGEVVEARVMFDRGTRKPRGFGFVHFADVAAAEAAAADTHSIDGRTVEAKKAVPRDEHVQLRYDGGGRASTASSSGSLHSSPGSGGTRCRKIFVGGLAPSTREDGFRAYFEKFGTISDAVVMYDHATQRPRGFGFVTYEEEDAVDEVFKLGAIHMLGDKKVECKRAVPKEHMPPGTSMRGGRSGMRMPGGASLMPVGGGGGSAPYGTYNLERQMSALSFGPASGAGMPGAYPATGPYSGAVGQQIAAHGYPGSFAAAHAAAYGAHPHAHYAHTTGGMIGSVGYGMSAATPGYAGYAEGFSAGSAAYGASIPYTGTPPTSGIDAGSPVALSAYAAPATDTMSQVGGIHYAVQAQVPVTTPGIAGSKASGGVASGAGNSGAKSGGGADPAAMGKAGGTQSFEVANSQTPSASAPAIDASQAGGGAVGGETAPTPATGSPQGDADQAAAAALTRGQLSSVTYSTALATGQNQQTDPPALPPTSFGVAGEYREYRPRFPYL